MTFRKCFSLLLCFVLTSLCISGCNNFEPVQHTEPVTLKKGLNLSALEDIRKPSSYLFKQKTYTDMVELGFDHVRLPVDFRTYADKNGVLKKSFFKRLDKIINIANNAGLAVMLDFHGWYDINVSNGDDELFLNIWSNVAKHYKDYSNMLMFELINEPHTTEGGDLDMPTLMDLQTRAIENIREISPERTIVVATAEWNGPWTLKDFELPNYDNLIVAIHTYEPLDFTHQGETWAGKGDISLKLSYAMLDGLKDQLKLITEFKERTGCDVVLNEFGLATTGAISEQDIDRYLSTITSYCEENDIPWTYWCYGGNFGVYETKLFGDGWRQNVLDALFDK